MRMMSQHSQYCIPVYLFIHLAFWNTLSLYFSLITIRLGIVTVDQNFVLSKSATIVFLCLLMGPYRLFVSLCIILNSLCMFFLQSTVIIVFLFCLRILFVTLCIHFNFYSPYFVLNASFLFICPFVFFQKSSNYFMFLCIPGAFYAFMSHFSIPLCLFQFLPGSLCLSSPCVSSSFN